MFKQAPHGILARPITARLCEIFMTRDMVESVKGTQRQPFQREITEQIQRETSC